MKEHDETPARVPNTEDNCPEQGSPANDVGGDKPKRRHRTTEKQLKANRENAKHSTGPRTPEGKSAARFNAVKDGFLAKEVMGSGKILGESLEENEAILSGLIEEHKPFGIAERFLVEEIAGALIRKKRLLRAEQAEIEHGQYESDITEAAEAFEVFSYAKQFPILFSARFDVLRSFSGVQHLRDCCAKALQELKSGQISKKLEEVEHICGLDLITEKDPSELMQVLIGIESDLAQTAAALKRKHELRKLGMSLPPASFSDRLIRYESMLDRHLLRALQQLEILQQRRRASEDHNG